MAPQIVGNHREVGDEQRQHETPGIAGRANSVNEEKRWAVAFNGKCAVDCCRHSAASFAVFRPAKCGMTSSAKHCRLSRVSAWLAPKLGFKITRSIPASA